MQAKPANHDRSIWVFLNLPKELQFVGDFEFILNFRALIWISQENTVLFLSILVHPLSQWCEGHHEKD